MAEYRLIFSADVNRSIRSISDLKQEIARVTKEFQGAEVGSKEFLREAEKLSGLVSDMKAAKSAIRDTREEMYRQQRAVEDLARSYRKAAEDRQKAIASFRMGMGAKGAIPEVASPIRGTRSQAGSPENRAFVAARRQGPIIDPGSMRALEVKLDTLRDKAARIKPDTEAWKRLQRNLRETEDAMTRMEKKRIPRGERMRGAIGGAAKRGRQAMAGAGAAALAGGGAGTIVGSGIGMMLGGPVGGLAGAGIGQAVDQLGAMTARTVEAYNAVERMKRGLALASVDATDFAESNRLVQESSQKLLMPLEKTYKHFSQLRVNTKQFGMTAQETQKVLEGTALAVASTGGSMEDIDGAMRAVVQIFSKGTVQAEELRGQLGERFPGAVVKFAAANKMSMQELQDALKRGEVGVAEFVAFAEQNFEDYAEYAESLATAPEYAAQRAKIAMDQLAVNIGAAFAPLGSEIQQVFADMMQGLSDFVRENKEGIDTFVRDLQIVIRRLADFGAFVADLMGKIAGYLAPVIDAMRELFGLKSANEFQVKAEGLGTQIQAVEQKRDAATGAERQRLNRQLDGLRKQRTKALADAAAAGADETQQQVDRTRGAVTGGKSYTFGGAGAGLSMDAPPKGTSGGRKAGKGRKDISSDVLALEQEILRIEEAIAMKKQGGNELMLIEAQLALELAKIGESEMKANEKALAIEKAESKALVDRVRFETKSGKELAAALIKEKEEREIIKQLMLDAQLAAGEITQKEYDRLQTLKDQKRVLEELRKAGATPEQIAAVEASQAKANEKKDGTSVRDGLNAWMEKTEKELKDFGAMAESVADGVASEFGTAFSGILQGTTSLQEGLGTAFSNIGKMFADMVAQMIVKWAMLQAFKGLGFAEGGVVSASSGGGVPSYVPGFATGGIVKGPTMAMVGEGRFNEAIVPLPNGKSIPVEMGGSAGSNISTNITVNVNNGQASSKTSGSQGNDLARNLEGAVKQVIMREMQPGGMISSGR